ncbi:alanine--tRNA ligase [Candidatus Wolfebacteria bacterium]|nr:alanine--tRNA ligase [Candidatus Wolfebacteria bacterium]
MKSNELRKKFIEYFEKNGHKAVPSSSLIPDDPSVLLTTAGMQQFKPYYVDKADAMKDFSSKNTTTVQKCFRTSDIDEVGDKTHLTFFEMLGNFSFGGYFKREAISWAYDFIINELGISRDRVTVTIFSGDDSLPMDDDSYKIWHEEIGLPKEKISKQGREDNFWGPTGIDGPCGPTTEIYVDGVEVWNLVFNEYFYTKDGRLEKLASPGIDTGMGLERLAVMLQGVPDVFETDLFHLLVSQIREVTNNLDEKVVRVLADHLRASIFLVADGLRPSNKEAGYILRRLLRRVLVYQIKYDIHAELFTLAVDIIKKEYGDWYPEVTKDKEIYDVLIEEKTKFEKALALGIKELEKYNAITAQDAFKIYESFGLPFELLQELVPSKMMGVKKEGFDKEFERHREISRAGIERKFGGHGLLLDTGELKAGNEKELKIVTRLHTATHMLQQALRIVLGDSVQQKGSDINAERLRFDFSFDRKLTEEELKKVENLVNEQIQKDLKVTAEEMPIEAAKKSGALFFFKEKYPEVVKVYSVGDFSKELCGGPHVEHTAIIGEFKIKKQESVGAGTKRIRAVVE